MWKVIKELKENRAKAFADAQTIRDSANKENRDLKPDEEKRHADLVAEVETYTRRLEREEKSAALEEAIKENRSLVGRENTASSLGMPEKDMRRYSILRAINLKAQNKPLDGLEAEVSAEIALRSGKPAQGFYVPLQTGGIETRTTGLVDTTTGTGSVGINLSSDMIELLRNKMVLNQLGVTTMTGMHGKFSLPRQSAGGTAYWVSEGNAPTTSNQTLDQVAFVPKTVGAYTDITRQFATQSSVDAENLVRNDLARVLAGEIDKAGLAGDGTSNSPTGALYVSGTTAVTHGASGGAETWIKVVEYETDVLGANIDPSARLSYVSNSKVNGSLKTIDKAAGTFGNFIIGNDGKCNNYPFVVTNAMPSNFTKLSATGLSSMAFGDFSQLVVAFWGGLDLLVDPFTGSSSGKLRIVVLQDVDIEFRHAAAFAVSKDIVA